MAAVSSRVIRCLGPVLLSMVLFLGPAHPFRHIGGQTAAGSTSSMEVATTSDDNERRGAGDCEERWHNVKLDHFRHQRPTAKRASTFPLRYLACDDYWDWFDGRKGPIFFYAGHQHDVTLYADNIGLMWETAKTFHAMLVFAEHRYYGKSQPFGPGSIETDPQYLSAEQAMSDYIELILHLRSKYRADKSPVIVFGASYGGILASLLRLKYPHIVKGAVSSSAPAGAFPSGLKPSYDPASYWQAVTYAAGDQPGCVDNVRAAFDSLRGAARTEEGLETLTDTFQLCSPLETEEDGVKLAFWIQAAFDTFARGNYPYNSSFVMGSLPGSLPPWPMKAACQHLSQSENPSKDQLSKGLKAVVDMLYNATGNQECHDLSETTPESSASDYQWCTQLIGGRHAVGNFPATGSLDMFWDQGALDMDSVEKRCAVKWGAVPDRMWAAEMFGGLGIGVHASNVVFTNGEFDPWASGGVMRSRAKRSVVALLVMQGAHASDLMHSTDNDPASFLGVRALQRAYIWKWLQEEYDEHRWRRMQDEGIEALVLFWEQQARDAGTLALGEGGHMAASGGSSTS